MPTNARQTLRRHVPLSDVPKKFSRFSLTICDIFVKITRMSATQRRKGHQFERDAANWFKSMGFDARRNMEYQIADGTDVIVKSGNSIIFNVQCKKGSHVPVKLYRFLEQLKDKAGMYRLVMCARDNKPDIVIMYKREFEEILKMLIAYNIIHS